MKKEFEKADVAIRGVDCQSGRNTQGGREARKEFGINFPVFLDRDLIAARALEANATPECFVLDGDFVVRYRGRIDNSYSERLKRHQQVHATRPKANLGEMLSGRPVSESATLPIGCPIVRDEPATRGQRRSLTTKMSLQSSSALPILPPSGEVGPFSLLTYKQAVNWRPTSNPTLRVGQCRVESQRRRPLHGERRLTDAET